MSLLRDAVFALEGVEVDSPHHPERDQFNHTVQVTFQALMRLNRVEPRFQQAFMMAAILHDVGKANTMADGGTMHGHEGVSADIVGGLLRLDGQPNSDIEWLVRHHLVVLNLDKMSTKKKHAIVTHPLFGALRVLRECDVDGRDPDFVVTPAVRAVFVGIMDALGI